MIALGLPPGRVPVIGSIGTSPAAPQPGPLMWVSEYPVIDESQKLYPALRVGIVSGLHCTMPNGTSAPGNVFPPPVVHVRVSTIGAGSVTAWVTVAWFFAPAGSLVAGTAPGQWTGRPFDPLVQAAVSDPALPGFVPAPDPAPADGLGFGPAAAGVALNNAAPPRMAAATRPTTARRRENGGG